MHLIATSFDHADRPFGWLDFLPKASDNVWVWAPRGELVSAMLARPLKLANGVNGVILGAVATVPSRRRQGMASQLVETGCQHYQEQGASFVIMWARDYLLSLYQPLGFEIAFREYYCDLEDGDGTVPVLKMEKFTAVSHEGFERLRLKIELKSAASSEYWPTERILKNGQWYGVMDGYPFAPEFSFVFSGPADNPAFYAVLGHGHETTTMMEFSGSANDFVKTRNWIVSQFPGKTVKFNVTAPHHQALADAAGVIHSEQNMCLLYRRLDTLDRAVPLATWLDRF